MKKTLEIEEKRMTHKNYPDQKSPRKVKFTKPPKDVSQKDEPHKSPRSPKFITVSPTPKSVKIEESPISYAISKASSPSPTPKQNQKIDDMVINNLQLP